MKKFFSIAIVSTTGLLWALTNTAVACAGAAEQYCPLSDRDRASVAPTSSMLPPATAAERGPTESTVSAAEGSGGAASSGSSSDAGEEGSLSNIPKTALGNIAGYLDPISASALRAANTSFSKQISSNKVMANYCIDKIVSGKTPNPSVVGHLGTMAPKDRQALLRTRLLTTIGFF